MKTIVLAVLAMVIPATAQAGDPLSGFYAEVYGGGSLGTDIEANLLGARLPFDLDAGALFGGGVGVDTGLKGLSVGVDTLWGRQNYDSVSGIALTATSVMANLRYTVPVSESFSIFAGAGAGVISLSTNVPSAVYYMSSTSAFTGTAAGGEVYAGASTVFDDAFELFGELRYQTSFGRPLLADAPLISLEHSFNRTAVLAGIRYLPGAKKPKTSVPGLYAEIFTGRALGVSVDGRTTYGAAPFDLDPGPLYGGALGLATSVPGLSAELDVLHGSRAQTGNPAVSLVGTTAMVDLRYTARFGDRLSAFAGAGAGGLAVTYQGSGVGDDNYGIAPAAQAFAGAGFAVSPKVDLFAEVRHQQAIGRIFMSPGVPLTVSQDYTRDAVLAGVRFRTN